MDGDTNHCREKKSESLSRWKKKSKRTDRQNHKKKKREQQER